MEDSVPLSLFVAVHDPSALHLQMFLVLACCHLGNKCLKYAPLLYLCLVRLCTSLRVPHGAGRAIWMLKSRGFQQELKGRGDDASARGSSRSTGWHGVCSFSQVLSPPQM